MTGMIDLSPEVGAALAAGAPVVALESTIIAHGMPWPANVEVAATVERIVREEGAVPATIAILGGRLKVGLSEGEIAHLARNGPSVLKVSTRDIPFAVTAATDGATTVAATMRIAALAGIRVFATGGIGGVHRGAESTFDISADLHELSLSDVAVVTAGAKAILDLGLTLETLETLGVPVIGYGTDEFPAFYSRRSGLKVPMRLDSPEAIAGFMRAKWELGLRGGVVVANPIPRADEIPAEKIKRAIMAVLAEARSRGIAGKELTPFLLAELARATGGRSLAANIALLRNNASLAARLAVASERRSA